MNLDLAIVRNCNVPDADGVGGIRICRVAGQVHVSVRAGQIAAAALNIRRVRNVEAAAGNQLVGNEMQQHRVRVGEDGRRQPVAVVPPDQVAALDRRRVTKVTIRFLIYSN